MQIKIPKLHPRSWATDLIDGTKGTREEACAILCGCWLVWLERNSVWHGNEGQSIIGSVHWVMESTFDLAQLGKKKASMLTKKIRQWQRPEMGVLKINVDAGFHADAR
jgi:hypothetical protein